MSLLIGQLINPSKMVITPHGHKYLEAAGVMETMGTMLQDCPNLPFSDVIMPGL